MFNKKYAKVMSKVEIQGLIPKRVMEFDSDAGYMQLISYVLQDYSFLDVLQWHFTLSKGESGFPEVHCLTFYRDRDNAYKEAKKVINEILKGY